MNIKKLREKAIKKYKNGESPKEIYQSLSKGKTWFFKWLKHHKLDEIDWVKSHFCRPYKSSNSLPKSSIDLSKIDL